MINKVFIKIVLGSAFALQTLLSGSVLNYSYAAGSSCGVPNYDRTAEPGIYLWQLCGTGEWSLRAVGGGRSNGNELRVVGTLKLTEPIQTLTKFSLEPGDPNEQFPEPDFVDLSNPRSIDFRFRVWSDAQDGMDFRLPANAIPCLEISLPRDMPIQVGGLRTDNSSPLNLLSLDSAGCSGLAPIMQILLGD